MTDKIKDYIAKMPKHEHWGWQWIKEVKNGDDMSGKIKNPFHEAEGIATFFLVGDDKTERNEETGEKTETFTITHLEFIDWGIIPDADDYEDIKITPEDEVEIVRQLIFDILELEVGDHKPAHYNSYNGWNLYRAPLKDAIVVVRKGEEVTIA
jgi:hypothetical protein